MRPEQQQQSAECAKRCVRCSLAHMVSARVCALNVAQNLCVYVRIHRRQKHAVRAIDCLDSRVYRGIGDLDVVCVRIARLIKPVIKMYEFFVFLS